MSKEQITLAESKKYLPEHQVLLRNIVHTMFQ